MREAKTKKSLISLLLVPVSIFGAFVLFNLFSAPSTTFAANDCGTTKTTYAINANSSDVVVTIVGKYDTGARTNGCQNYPNGGKSTLKQVDQSLVFDGKIGVNTCPSRVTLSTNPVAGTTDSSATLIAPTITTGSNGKGEVCGFSNSSSKISVVIDKNANVSTIAKAAVAKPQAQSATTATESSCSITGGLGWIICPAITTVSSFTSGLYNFVASLFLATNVNIVTIHDSSGNLTGTYQAWQAILTVANIIFVIIFLFIIFSQATGYGISNYGIKKMLPKMIIGVILMNLSFFICQVAVDVSNLLGYGLSSFFTNQVKTTISWNTLGADIVSGGLIAGTAIALFNIAFGGSAIMIAFITLLFIALFLLIRQVLIIMCVVMAPIAFAAWLLPNTEKLFKRWWKIFYAMLILFPLSSVIFGASQLASQVISTSLTTNKVSGTAADNSDAVYNEDNTSQ